MDSSRQSTAASWEVPFLAMPNSSRSKTLFQLMSQQHLMKICRCKCPNRDGLEKLWKDNYSKTNFRETVEELLASEVQLTFQT